MIQLEFSLRAVLRRDLDELLDLDRAEFDSPWQRSDFDAMREGRDRQLLVLERQYKGTRLFEDIVGYIAYDVRDTSFRIRRILVAQELRRRGLGRHMIETLMSRLTEERRQLSLVVSERDLGMQLFLRSCGLKAVNVLQQHFGSHDGYLFQYETLFAELAG